MQDGSRTMNEQNKSEQRQKLEKKGERQTQLEERPYLGEDGAPTGTDRSGGRLARDIGTRDEKKRTFERPGSTTGVTKSDEKD